VVSATGKEIAPSLSRRAISKQLPTPQFASWTDRIPLEKQFLSITIGQQRLLHFCSTLMETSQVEIKKTVFPYDSFL
jgi:hypothetical protein